MRKWFILGVFVIVVGSELIASSSQATKMQAEYVPPPWSVTPIVAEYVPPVWSTTELG